MAAAVLIEEELRNNMVTSEEDAEFEEDDEVAADAMSDNADAYAADQLQNGIFSESVEDHKKEEEEREQADGQEDDDDDVLTDLDAEGEEEDGDIGVQAPEIAEDLSASDAENDDEDGDEEGEGVGAVKIQPGGLDDDEEEALSESGDEESVVSDGDDIDSKDSTDAEIEAEWEAAPDEDEEATNPNRCIFCHQDEEKDPSEEFELYLACGICGDNAHRQCARNAHALKPDEESDPWYCPDCVDNKLVPQHEFAAAETAEQIDGPVRMVSRDRVPGDLLPSQRGGIKHDSHSVFNQLIAPDDPMDGSRLLRKRKTSSSDAEPVDVISPRRTRDRDITKHAIVPQLASNIESIQVIDIGKADKAELLTNGSMKKTEAPVSPRASRSLRPKSSSANKPPVRILEKSTTTLKISIRTDPIELRHVLSQPPKPKKKRRPTPGVRSIAPASNFVSHNYSQPFYALHDKEMDELKSKPYGGILTEAEADTVLTLPESKHRRAFDEARQKAEEEWKARAASAAEAAAASGLKKARKVSGPASQIEYIEFGQYQIDIWYAAPYPEEYSRNKALFICEFCLKYMESDIVAWRHKTKCPWKHPPGDEIYRDGKVMIFEVDGRKNPLYCQNLCLLAKLFLGSKTLYYDVEPFLFYVMTEYDELGGHFVGYFSKEKRPSSLNNVSCILVLPIHQRKGYGNLLIDFSYLLTRVERKTGSPEKPLSDMGLVSYRNYWRLVLCYYFQDYNIGDQIPSIKTISNTLGLTPDDVVSALDALSALIRDPVTGTYAMRIRTNYYQQVIQNHEAKGYAKLNPKSLVWTPYIMGRGNASAFDHAPPLNTVAPREDEEEANKPSQPDPSTGGKRDFSTFSGTTNGDTETITNSMNNLTTDNSESIHTGGTSETSHSNSGSSESQPTVNGIDKRPTYYETASSIPATRFEIYPPPAGSRRPNPTRPAARHAARSSSSVPRASRPTPRRSTTGGSSRRPTSSRQSSSRRKSGGTGRGPGRWPKGTKKSDFGNADSGPGLPPRLINHRSGLENEVLLDDDEEEEDEYQNDEDIKNESEEGDEEEEEEDPDAILYETPATRKRRDRNSRRITAVGLGKPDPEVGGEQLGKGSGLGKPLPGKTTWSGYEANGEEEGEEDVDMDDAPAEEEEEEKMDVDADSDADADADADGEEE